MTDPYSLGVILGMGMGLLLGMLARERSALFAGLGFFAFGVGVAVFA